MNNMPEIFSLLKRLKENNNREWYHEHKDEVDQLRKAFSDDVETLISGIGVLDPEIAYLQPSKAIFRLARDTRFSHDKTPYKTHFGAYIAPGGRRSPYGGYYLHVSPGESLLACGIWCPQPAALKLLRQEVFDHLDELLGILESTPFSEYFMSFEGESLKRVPQPYTKEVFARPELLKLKNYCMSCALSDELFESPDWMTEVLRRCQIARPLNEFLNRAIRRS